MKKWQFFLVILIILTAPSAAQSRKAQPKKQTASASASLDLLVRRVEGYWGSLLKKKKAEAAKYITPKDQDNFYNNSLPSFSEPRFKSLELSSSRKEAKVTVVVKRLMKPLDQVEWPVTEHWQFENGNWYRSFAASSNFLTLGTDSNNPEFSEVESIRNEIKKSLRIENTVFELGRIKPEKAIPIKISYDLSGDQRLSVNLKLPSGIRAPGGEIQSFEPGRHELTVEFLPWMFEGDVDVQVTLNVNHQKVKVPYEVTVKGHVYVPIVLSTSVVKFKKGEIEKSLEIRNNSQSVVEIKGVYSETDRISIEPCPASIEPGQKIIVQVKARPGVDSKPNRADSVSIILAKPVDGMNGLSFTAMLNYIEKDPSAKKTPEELLRGDESQTCKAPLAPK